MTHAGTPNASEITGNLRALNAYAGIPVSEIIGFRAPLLSWNGSTLQHLKDFNFTYDSSMTSASPANASSTDAYWPYTLDYGIANNCLFLLSFLFFLVADSLLPQVSSRRTSVRESSSFLGCGRSRW